MRAGELELERLLVGNADEGTLEVRGGRVVVSDAAATWRLVEELEETLGAEAARGVLLRHGFQSGYQDATRLRTYFAWDSDLEWLLAAGRTRTILGHARVEFLDLVVDRSRGLFRAAVVARNSYEAAAAKQRRGPGPCACHRLSGYLTGYASAWLGDTVLFVEQECGAESEESTACRFEGRPVAEWGPEGEVARRGYQRDAIGERLAHRDREVLAQAIKIREQELELETKHELEQASRLKSQFLATISHELRTPLNSIIGFADLLLAKLGPKLPETPRHNLERILGNAEHLLRLINSVLDISKIEAGRLELHLEEVDISEVLARCMEDTAVLLRGKPVALQLEPCAGLPRVRADALRLRQCLTNVLGNAAKFTDAGSIRVEARQVSGQRGGREVPFLAITVSDTGPGIAPEHQALVFEPFRQVDGGHARVHGGTGLGLPIARQLLEKMGGELRLQSTPGVGSSFSLVIPVATEPSTPGSFSPARPREPGRPTPPRSRRILLVDDDPDSATLVRELLAGAPEPRVRKAALEVEPDPVKAVAQARLDPPDLVLLDLQLPAVDGREVLRNLKADPRTCDVPVVVVSVRDDARETLGEGAAAALAKPIEPGALFEVIAAQLPPEAQP